MLYGVFHLIEWIYLDGVGRFTSSKDGNEEIRKCPRLDTSIWTSQLEYLDFNTWFLIPRLEPINLDISTLTLESSTVYRSSLTTIRGHYFRHIAPLTCEPAGSLTMEANNMLYLTKDFRCLGRRGEEDEIDKAFVVKCNTRVCLHPVSFPGLVLRSQSENGGSDRERAAFLHWLLRCVGISPLPSSSRCCPLIPRNVSGIGDITHVALSLALLSPSVLTSSKASSDDLIGIGRSCASSCRFWPFNSWQSPQRLAICCWDLLCLSFESSKCTTNGLFWRTRALSLMIFTLGQASGPNFSLSRRERKQPIADGIVISWFRLNIMFLSGCQERLFETIEHIDRSIPKHTRTKIKQEHKRRESFIAIDMWPKVAFLRLSFGVAHLGEKGYSFVLLDWHPTI
jgi:hypothetical protein